MNEEKKKIVLVTGANGFIGRNLSEYFNAQGYSVRGLVRFPEKITTLSPSVRLFQGNLPDHVDATAFEKADTVIHCAYRTRHRAFDNAGRDNEEGTKLVLRLSRNAMVGRVIFLSSLSAHEHAQSYYGRSKLALEKLFDQEHDLIIRAGLVIGRGEAGIFSRMIHPVRTFPFVPLLDGGQQLIQIIHIDDLCSAIHSVIKKNITGTLSIADPVGISLKDFLRNISKKLGKKRIFLPVPSAPLLSCIKLLEHLHVPTPISSENILGLQHIRYVDTRADLSRIGIKLPQVTESIDRIFSPA